MNLFTQTVAHVYSKLLNLYPRRFQEEFAEEMQVVFNDSLNEAIKDGIAPLILICLRELGGLPFNILQEFRHEFERKEINMTTVEKVDPRSTNDDRASRWNALFGTLPFALFGIASIMAKLDLPVHGAYPYLAFFAIVLPGLLIGIVKGVPRWTYSYLGWSLVFASWWSNMGTAGLKIFGFQINYWTWQIWPPLLAIIGVALLWTRSLRPLRVLILNIWQDWSLLSLAMYTFVGWMALLYDENHHPYLFAFMTASTLVVSGGAWLFLRERRTRKRIVALLSSCAAIAVIGTISEATWDWRAYYGLPPQPPVAWYVSALRVILMLAIWGAILFWPVLVGLARRKQSRDGLVK
ncbi:MAG: hypothetical protein L6Q26_03410 [Anaerolineales bacterium]|nr:hypothetical protein [Anaerolineales bacterium]NUQ85630.1 hypothetical protein [Anaerolineales bacterium]